MKAKLPLLALLLATAACATPYADVATPAPAAAPTQTEDARLLAFLDAAFEESVALSPQSLTALGRKERYDELNDYTDAQSQEQRALAEAQLARMKAEFDYEALSPAGQLSYRLFEHNVVQGREQFEWRWHNFPVTVTGSPAGSIPVFLINQHRVDTVADAEAYIARLTEVERVMGEGSARAGCRGAHARCRLRRPSPVPAAWRHCRAACLLHRGGPRQPR